MLARSSLTRQLMKRTFWIAVALVAAVTTVVLVREQQRLAGSASGGAVLGSQPMADVQVRHEFVTVAAPAPAPLLETRSVTPGPAAPRRTDRQGSIRQNEALLSRARRAFLGDGRYRPEPFPRAK